MKNLNQILALGMLIALGFTACVTEEIKVTELENNPELTAKQIIDQHAAAIDRFEKKFPDARVDFSTLEEMNESIAAAGLETITLEDLGATQEEYDAAQERLFNHSEASTLRCPPCSGTLAIYFGDMNNDGVLSNADINLATECLLFGTNNCAAGPFESSRYGYMSAVWGFGNPHFSTQDNVVVRQIILGLAPCM